MNNFIKTKLFILPCFFIFASCATKNTVQEQHDDDHSATSVRLSAAQQQAIGIELGEITQRNLKNVAEGKWQTHAATTKPGTSKLACWRNCEINFSNGRRICKTGAGAGNH